MRIIKIHVGHCVVKYGPRYWIRCHPYISWRHIWQFYYWQSFLTYTPPLFCYYKYCREMLFAPLFFMRITFRDIFRWGFFLCVIFAKNIIFLVKIKHLKTKWQFVGIKRCFTGLKYAWYASTIVFLHCQLTLGPDPYTMMTLWLIDGWPLIPYILCRDRPAAARRCVYPRFLKLPKATFMDFGPFLVQLKTWRSSIFFSFLRILGAFFVPFEDIGPWQFDPRPIFWPPLASRKPLFRISGCSVQIWHHAFLGGFSPPLFLRYHTFETKYDVC